MARCSGREHPSGLTFAPSTNGRTRRVPNRYCGSRTSISPNFVCQRSFFHLGDASVGVGESPAPSPPPAARPNSSAPPVPEDASPQPSALPQHRLPSIRLAPFDRQHNQRHPLAKLRLRPQRRNKRLIAQRPDRQPQPPAKSLKPNLPCSGLNRTRPYWVRSKVVQSGG